MHNSVQTVFFIMKTLSRYFNCPGGDPPMGSPCPTRPSDRGILLENTIIGRPRSSAN